MKIRLNNPANHLFFWLSIIGLMLIEFILFRIYVTRELVLFYPNNFDQAGYLAQSYIQYENTLSEGLLTQFKNGSFGLATSFTFILQTVIAFMLFGASRFTALAIGFIYFAALQILMIKVALDVTGKRLFALLLLGLLLSVTTTFYWAGSIFDFRIDFMAVCVFGMVVSAVIQSDIFLSKKWTIITAFLSAYLILLRYITATYLFGIYFALLAYLFFLIRKKNNSVDLIKLRIKHIALCLVITILIVAPFLWSGWAAFYHYYVGNHVFSNEKYIRAAQVGVTSFFSSLYYYPKSIIKDHLGPLALSFIFLSMLGIGLISKRMRFKIAAKDILTNLVSVFLILCILVPIMILTLDYAKSPVVGNITVVPILWLVTWVIFLAYTKSPTQLFKNFIILVTMLSLLGGMIHYVTSTLHRTSKRQKQNLYQITQMYLDLGNYLNAQGKDHALYSSDRIADYLVPQVLSIIYYENKGVLLHPASSLFGSTLYAIDKEAAIKTLKTSDIFIVNLDTYSTVAADYPFNDSLNQLRPELRKLAEHTFLTLGDYELNGYKYRVYVKNEKAMKTPNT